MIENPPLTYIGNFTFTVPCYIQTLINGLNILLSGAPSMSTLSRSMKNVFGKKVRTLVIVVIIGFSLGVFLTMSIVSQNISEGTSDIAQHMERTAIVTSAGVDKGVAMNETNLTNISTVKNVESVQMVIVTWHFNETAPGVSLVREIDCPTQRPGDGRFTGLDK